MPLRAARDRRSSESSRGSRFAFQRAEQPRADLGTIGEQPGKRAVDHVAACRNPEPGAGGVIDDELRRRAQRRRQRARQRSALAVRPSGGMGDAPRVARQCLARFGNHACDPGLAAFGLAPPIAKRRGQFLPAGREEFSGAPLFAQTPMRLQPRPRRSHARFESPPLFVQGIAHAARALRHAPLRSSLRRASAHRRVIASQRRLRSVSTRSSSARMRDSSVIAHPRARAAPRSRVARSGIAHLPPQIRDDQRERCKRRLGESEIGRGNSGRDIGGDQHQRRALRVPPQAPRFRRRRAER